VRVKDWEIIARNLKKAGWSLGYVSAIDSNGRTIWIAYAHRDGKRFIVPADEKLTTFRGGRAAVKNAAPSDSKPKNNAPATEHPFALHVFRNRKK
jgi:hypothetical protein